MVSTQESHFCSTPAPPSSSRPQTPGHCAPPPLIHFAEAGQPVVRPRRKITSFPSSASAPTGSPAVFSVIEAFCVLHKKQGKVRDTGRVSACAHFIQTCAMPLVPGRSFRHTRNSLHWPLRTRQVSLAVFAAPLLDQGTQPKRLIAHLPRAHWDLSVSVLLRCAPPSRSPSGVARSTVCF